MPHPRLTLRGITARAVVLPLKRPVVARIATLTQWPMVLIDLTTEEGVVGRSYLEPYAVQSMRYLVAALEDLGNLLKGRQVAPAELFQAARKSLHFVGYEGLSMIACSGLDMAAWDALAKAADMPLCVLLGGSTGAVKAYNSNGLWLREPAAVAEEAIALRDEGGFAGLKLRLGRERRADDLVTIEAVRRAVGDEISLMVDYRGSTSRRRSIAANQSTVSDSNGSRNPSFMTTSTGWPGSLRTSGPHSRSARISTARAKCTRRWLARRATSSCPTSCGSAA